MQINPQTIAEATVERLRADVSGIAFRHFGQQIHIYDGDISMLTARECAGKQRAVIDFRSDGTRIIAYRDILNYEYANPGWYDWLVQEVIKLR